jgi:hypothetical protein
MINLYSQMIHGGGDRNLLRVWCAAWIYGFPFQHMANHSISGTWLLGEECVVLCWVVFLMVRQILEEACYFKKVTTVSFHILFIPVTNYPTILTCILKFSDNHFWTARESNNQSQSSVFWTQPHIAMIIINIILIIIIIMILTRSCCSVLVTFIRTVPIYFFQMFLTFSLSQFRLQS